MGGLLHLVQQGGACVGWGSAQSPPHCTKCNSPPISGQCTNHCVAISWCVAVQFNVAIKGLTSSSAVPKIVVKYLILTYHITFMYYVCVDLVLS